MFFWREVRRALGGRPWLWLIEGLIAERLREVDDTLFVVRNTLEARFEVHCLEHSPDTIAWVVPWQQLDERTIRKARENRVERQWDLLRRMDERNERWRDSKQRDFRNWVHGVSEDARSLFTSPGRTKSGWMRGFLDRGSKGGI